MQFFEISHSMGSSGMLLCFINPFCLKLYVAGVFLGHVRAVGACWVLLVLQAARGCLQGVWYFYTLTKIAFYAVAICVTGCLELIEVKEEVGEQQRHIGKMGCVRMTNATQFRQLGLWECAGLNHVSSLTVSHSVSFFQLRIIIKSVFCTNTQSRFASAVLLVTWDLIA